MSVWKGLLEPSTAVCKSCCTLTASCLMLSVIYCVTNGDTFHNHFYSIIYKASSIIKAKSNGIQTQIKDTRQKTILCARAVKNYLLKPFLLVWQTQLCRMMVSLQINSHQCWNLCREAGNCLLLSGMVHYGVNKTLHNPKQCIWTFSHEVCDGKKINWACLHWLYSLLRAGWWLGGSGLRNAEEKWM